MLSAIHCGLRFLNQYSNLLLVLVTIAYVWLGECKTAYDLKDKEKKDIKDLGLATGAYVAFAIDAVDFSDDDKAYFRELVEAGIKPILLVRKHPEMSYRNETREERGLCRM